MNNRLTYSAAALFFVLLSTSVFVCAQNLPAGQVSSGWSGDYDPDPLGPPTLHQTVQRFNVEGKLRRNGGVYGFWDESIDTQTFIRLPQLDHVNGEEPSLCDAFVGGRWFWPNNIYYMSWHLDENANMTRVRIVNGYSSERDPGVPLEISGVEVTGIGIEGFAWLNTGNRNPFEIGQTTSLLIDQFTVNFRGPAAGGNGKGKNNEGSLATCVYGNVNQAGLTFDVQRYN